MKKQVIIGVIVGLLLLPTIALGGTFISSLIQGKSVPEALNILAQQIDALIGRVDQLEESQNKEEVCRKANELKMAPEETKIAYHTQSGMPIYHKSIPDTTEALLEYIYGYINNYETTGNPYYSGQPDYTPENARKYLPILEFRFEEYRQAQELCDGTIVEIQENTYKNNPDGGYVIDPFPVPRPAPQPAPQQESKLQSFSETNCVLSATITIYNNYSGGEQNFIANTRFESENGYIFRIDKKVIVPSKIGNTPGKIETKVHANEDSYPREDIKGNFSIPGFKGQEQYEFFYATLDELHDGCYEPKPDEILEDGEKG